MIKIFCDVCGEETSERNLYSYDLCKKCIKKFDDYFKSLKKQEKSKKPKPKGWGRTYG